MTLRPVSDMTDDRPVYDHFTYATFSSMILIITPSDCAAFAHFSYCPIYDTGFFILIFLLLFHLLFLGKTSATRRRWPI